MNEKKELSKILRKNAINDDKLFNPKDKVIQRLASKVTRKIRFQTIPVSEWNNTDFLRYLCFVLKNFGVGYGVTNLARDCHQLNSVFDMLLTVTGKSTSNEMMKNYIDWWCSKWAGSFSSRDFGIWYLRDLDKMKMFIEQFTSVENNVSLSKSEITSQEQIYSDDSIYELGGLSMLLLKRGFVKTCKFLETKGEKNIYASIRNAIKNFGVPSLMTVWDNTLQNGPYKFKCAYDFVTLVREYLPNDKQNDIDILVYNKLFT